MARYGTKLTARGIEKLTQAQMTSNKLQITHLAVGDANGAYYTPTGAETALRKEVWRGAINKSEIDTAEANRIVVEGVVPASAGGFTIREVALYDADGDMIAIGNYPETPKTTAADGTAIELIIRTVIRVDNVDSVDVTLDPNVVMANVKYVDEEIAVVTTQLAQIAINGKIFGATGSGVYDDTLFLQEAFDLASGGNIILPFGFTFKVTSLTIHPNTTVDAYGAKIINNSSHQTILNVGLGVKIRGLEVEGFGNDILNYSGKAVEIKGEFNETIGVVKYVGDIHFRDCYFHDLGGYGVYCEYAHFVKLDNCKIERVGYAGVQTLSSRNVQVNFSEIRGILGNGTIGYNVSFTRNSVSTDLHRYPRSKECSVSHCIIEDNPTWEGLDTHAGDNINFDNNTVRNCNVGIAFVGAANKFAPQNCSAFNNTIEGSGLGIGIVVAGANDVTTVFEYADNCRLVGNNIVRCGEEGNNISGAIHLYSTRGLVVQGNTLRECFISGINLYKFNSGFVVQGNTIVDVQSATINADGIDLRVSDNEGVISGNVILRLNPSLNTNVLNRGIRCESSSNTKVALGSNYITALIELSGLSGAHVDYMTYGVNSKIYVIDGSPESVVSAPVSSMCFNRNGSTGTTFYVKESGTGATGWVAK